MKTFFLYDDLFILSSIQIHVLVCFVPLASFSLSFAMDKNTPPTGRTLSYSDESGWAELKMKTG